MKNQEKLIAFLNESKNKKVSTVLEQILELIKTPTAKPKCFRKDDEGNITHIFCYYHKEWEALSEVEYGNKKHSTTGFNTMCKEGVRNWTKQQRTKKQAESELLNKLASKEITIEQLPKLQEDIHEASQAIIPLSSTDNSETNS